VKKQSVDFHILISAMIGIVGKKKAEKILEHYGELIEQLGKVKHD